MEYTVLLLAAIERCGTGAIRLQGGGDNSTGRVEVCLGDTWGTVCSNSWSVEDAKVACRQLGFSQNGITV